MNIDLRSDTVTRPSKAMRQAMYDAPVGDDARGEDPTVQKLEQEVAFFLGKEAAVFVPTGTMGNLASLKSFMQSGDAVIASSMSHLVKVESEGLANLNLSIVPIGNQQGFFDASDLEKLLITRQTTSPPLRVIAIENTVNFSGGKVFPFKNLQGISEFAKKNNLKMHLDGARLMNAVVASGIPAREWAKYFDTVTICLSKGLGGPMGSVIVSSAKDIEKVRHQRKLMGGAMRQAGLVAASGIFAINNNIERLAVDHENATLLAEGLKTLGAKVDPWPETNIVHFTFNSIGSNRVVELLKQRNILTEITRNAQIRAVTHLDVSMNQIQTVLQQLNEVIKSTF